MRAAASTFIILALVAVVAYVALRGPGHAPVLYVPRASTALAAVSGRAIDRAGRPVADVPLDWFSAVESRGGFFGGTMFRGAETGVRTNADGTFQLAGLRGEEGYVAVGSSDRLREGRTGRVRLRPGFDATELELTVVEVPVTRRLPGKVVHADGSPASVLVEARGGSWRGNWQQNELTGATGEFEFVGPWAGAECELWLKKPGDPDRSLGTFRLGTRGIVVRLP